MPPSPPTLPAEPVWIVSRDSRWAREAEAALRRQGSAVETIRSSREALARRETHAGQIVVLDGDLAAPDASAWQAWREAGLPLILVVAADRPADPRLDELLCAAEAVITPGGDAVRLLCAAVLRAARSRQRALRHAELDRQLTATQQLLEMVVDAVGGGRGEHDIATGRRTWSRELFEYFGQNWQGEPPRDEQLRTTAIDPADLPALRRAYESLRTFGTPTRFEFRVLQPDGTKRWLQVVGTAVRDAQGRPQRVMGVALDVTATRDVGPARHHSEQMMRAFTTNSREALLVVDANARVLYASPRNVAITGRTAGEIQQQSIWHHLHPEDAARLQAEWPRVLSENGNSQIRTARLLHADGTWRWIEGAFQVLLSDPAVGGVLINFRDVTARKRSEVYLEQERLALTQLLSGAPLDACIGSVLRAIDAHLPDARSMFCRGDLQRPECPRLLSPYLPVQEDRELADRCARALGPWLGPDKPAAEPRLVETLDGVRLAEIIPECSPGRPVQTAFLAPVLDGRGQVLGLLAVFLDHRATPEWLAGTLLERAKHVLRLACEHRATQDALHDNRLILEQAVSAAQMGTLVLDVARGTVEASPKALALFGLPAEQPVVPLSTALAAVGPADRDKLDFSAAALRQGRDHHVMEIRAGAPEAPRWLRCEGQTYFDERGAPQRVVCVCYDITQRKSEAAALAQSEQRYRELVERAPLAIFVTARDRFVFANEAAVALFGVRHRDELLGRPTLDVIRPDILHHESLTLQEILEGNLSAMSTATCFIRPDGQLVEVEVSSIQCVHEGAAALQVVMQDIRERKRLDEESRERQSQIAHLMRLNAIGQMAAELAHEVNQPLYAITNYTSAALELLERQPTPPPRESLEWLRNVTEQANRAGAILRRIGRFVRKDPPAREIVYLNDLLWDTAALLEFDLRSSGVLLNMTLSEPSPRVVIEPLQVEQVLVNLLNNAVQAMEQMPRDERRLLLRTRDLGDQVEVAVKDSGPGAPDEKLARLFEPFYSTKPSGLGLGLAISRSIIEAHHGRLWVEANRDRGVTFRFTLPIWGRGEDHE